MDHSGTAENKGNDSVQVPGGGGQTQEEEEVIKSLNDVIELFLKNCNFVTAQGIPSVFFEANGTSLARVVPV